MLVTIAVLLYLALTTTLVSRMLVYKNMGVTYEQVVGVVKSTSKHRHKNSNGGSSTHYRMALEEPYGRYTLAISKSIYASYVTGDNIPLERNVHSGKVRIAQNTADLSTPVVLLFVITIPHAFIITVLGGIGVLPFGLVKDIVRCMLLSVIVLFGLYFSVLLVGTRYTRKAVASVVSVEEVAGLCNVRYLPTIRYNVPGDVIVAKLKLPLCDYSRWRRDDQIRILYNPRNPEDFALDSSSPIPLLFTVLALFPLFISALT